MAKSNRKPKDFPKRVMMGVYWSFSGRRFVKRSVFNEKVREYYVKITKEDTWRPDEIVIPSPRVSVAYVHWKGDEQWESTVELTSDDGKAFSAGELLFKLHNAVVGPLKGDSHSFFDGLTLHSHQTPGAPPHYVLVQGS